MLRSVVDYEHGPKPDDEYYRESKGMLKVPKVFRILTENVLWSKENLSLFQSNKGEFIYSFHSSILFPVLSPVPRRSLHTTEIFHFLLMST